MRLTRSSVAALMGIVTVTGLVSCKSGAVSERWSGQGAGLAKIPALQLPRRKRRTVPGEARGPVWAAGVAEAASMYFPAEMPVFSVVPSTPKETALAAVASLGQPLPAGIDDGTAPPDSGSYTAAIRDAHTGAIGIQAYADGNYSIRYRDRDPLRALRKGTDKAPGVDETIAAVNEYLAEHPGLLPVGARLVEVVPIGTMGDFVRVRGAVFRRFRHGFPEGSFTVGVNTNAEVCMLSRNMRNLTPVGDYPILSPAEAAGLFNSPAVTSDGLDAVDIAGPARIDRVEMEYWDGGTAWQMDSIQPVYRFTGTVHNAAGDSGSFTVTVPAVRPEYTTPVELPRPRGARATQGSRLRPSYIASPKEHSSAGR